MSKAEVRIKCGIVEMMLNHDFGFELDVLKKNDFGRSILTEGFESKKTKLVGFFIAYNIIR